MNYDHVLFFSSIAEVDNIMDMDETLKTKSEHEKITREIEQHLKDKTLLTFALSSDSCQLCDKYDGLLPRRAYGHMVQHDFL